MQHFINTKKQLSAIIIMAAIAILTLPLMAQAQTLDCDFLNHPDQQEGMIITIIEEQIGNISSDHEIGSTIVLQCFREINGLFDRDVDAVERQPNLVEAPLRWFWNEGIYTNSCTPEQPDANPEAGSMATLCQRVQVFVAGSGTDLLFSYLGTIYRWAAGIVGIVTVFYIVWGGIMLTTAGDNTGQVDEAKQKIMQSIAGLVLLFLSAIILYTINPNFFTL